MQFLAVFQNSQFLKFLLKLLNNRKARSPTKLLNLLTPGAKGHRAAGLSIYDLLMGIFYQKLLRSFYLL